MEIKVVEIPKEKRKPIPKDDMKLGFGRIFTDHMFLMDFKAGKGWHDPRIEPYRPLSLDPACMVLHYGQEVFEGLKAYRGHEGGIYLFRHHKNLERFNRSCRRLVMPEIDVPLVDEALRKLILLDRDWIPKTEGCALYIRPTQIAMDPFLGVRPSETYLFYIILSPVAAYYPEGFNPVSIYVSSEYVRAVRGGIGEAKTSSNYAASLLGQVEAKKAGYTQVLWLDAIEKKNVEEVGTMNIFFVMDGVLVTSPLTGSILPGVTRDSVLHLANTWNMKVEERNVSIDEVIEKAQHGKLTECFGSGTAAIISPVKAIGYKGKETQVADGKTGPIAQKLYDYLLKIQYGRLEGPSGWVVRIDE